MPEWKLNPNEPHGPQIRAALTNWRFNLMAKRYLTALSKQSRPLSGRQVNAVQRVVNLARLSPKITAVFLGACLLAACGRGPIQPTHTQAEGVSKCTAACSGLGQQYAGHSDWTEPHRYLCACTTEGP